jgi:hypothetical protein
MKNGRKILMEFSDMKDGYSEINFIREMMNEKPITKLQYYWLVIKSFPKNIIFKIVFWIRTKRMKKQGLFVE